MGSVYSSGADVFDVGTGAGVDAILVGGVVLVLSSVGAVAFGFLQRGGLSNVRVEPEGHVGSMGGWVLSLYLHLPVPSVASV